MKFDFLPAGLLLVVALSGCATAPHVPDPEPIRKMTPVSLTVSPDKTGVCMSFEDMNAFNVWLEDVLRYMYEQNKVVEQLRANQ